MSRISFVDFLSGACSKSMFRFAISVRRWNVDRARGAKTLPRCHGHVVVITNKTKERQRLASPLSLISMHPHSSARHKNMNASPCIFNFT